MKSPNYLMQTAHRRMVVARVEFDTNGGGAPDGLIDEAGIVASLALPGAGDIDVTLTDKFSFIGVLGVQILDTTADSAIRAHSVVYGTSTNVVSLATYAPSSGAWGNTTDKHVVLYLQLDTGTD